MHIIGVAEPRSVRNIFQEAIMYDMPLMDRVRLDTLVTVIDCSSFLDYIKSSKLVNIDESPELFNRDGVQQMKEEEEDDFWFSASIFEGTAGGVCDLLVDQTEVADVILLNKIDLVGQNINEVKETISALNPRAKILPSSFGKVDHLNGILAYSKGRGCAIDGVVDDHKDFVNAADTSNCSDPDCANPLHSHDHSCNSHEHEQASVYNNVDSHDHIHFHSHKAEKCQSSICNDPDCHDQSHSHSHTLEESHSSTTHAGIGSFVYRARRPFHPDRILSVLNRLPIVRGLSNIEIQDVDMNKYTIDALRSVIRSKGFAWTADSNVKALYWSHAGTCFEMQCIGRWWSTLPRSQWPEEAKKAIISDFDDPDHDELLASTSVGDRRQEIVFIGPGLAIPEIQQAIIKILDSCLLDDKEWDLYRSKRTDESALASIFANQLQPRMLTY